MHESHTRFVSLVSAWELAIKASLGKIVLPEPIEAFFATTTRDLLARTLGLELGAVARVASFRIITATPSIASWSRKRSSRSVPCSPPTPGSPTMS